MQGWAVSSVSHEWENYAACISVRSTENLAEEMRRRKRNFCAVAASSGLLLVAGAIALSGQESAQTMTKLVVRLESPEIPPQSFEAKPKTMYRAGNGYCRTEELPDPEHGIYGLMVINEPDVWMVNLLTKTAQHYVDPGPTFNCRMPMFQGETVKSAADMKNPILELEFGRELEYFKGKGVTPKEGPLLRDSPTTVYAVDIGDSQLFLFTTGTPEQPWAVARQRGNMREVFWYGSYAQLPFDPKLFAKPLDVTIEEAK